MPDARRMTGAFVETLSELDHAPLARGGHRDPFMTALQRPEPAATRLAVAPTRPALPAFPYRYAGTLKKADGVTEAFLLRGADLVPIKAGVLLDGTWLIEALTEDRIEVTFVPAGERLSMLLASLVAEPGIPVAQPTITTPNASVAAASNAAASNSAASAATSIALGSPTPPTATPLGSEPPAQGSMPLGPAPSGSFPQGVTPAGQLGL